MLQQVSYKFPKDMISKLRAESKHSGVPVSEIVRRAIDKHLSKGKGEKS